MATINSAAVNIGGCMYLSKSHFSSAVCPGTGLQDHTHHYFSFLRSLPALLHSGCPNLHPTHSAGGLPFLHTLSRIHHLQTLWWRPLRAVWGGSSHSFNVHSPNSLCFWGSFHVLLTICTLQECLWLLKDFTRYKGQQQPFIPSANTLSTEYIDWNKTHINKTFQNITSSNQKSYNWEPGIEILYSNAIFSIKEASEGGIIYYLDQE